MNFIEYLKLKMDERRLGVNELARLSGVSNSLISNILKGKRPVTVKTITKLAPVLNVSNVEMLQAAGYIVEQIPADHSQNKLTSYNKSNLPDDPAFDEIREAWDTLPPSARSAIETIVKMHLENVSGSKRK